RGVPSADHCTSSGIRLLRGRHVACGHVGAGTEEMVFHLALEVLACALIRQIQSVLVHQHGLVTDPTLPGFLAHVLVDALAELAGIGRKVEALGFSAELDAMDGAGHARNSWELISLCG